MPRPIVNPRETIREVGEWAQNQPWHPNHAPDYGVVEEVGELTHAILKHIQKIRGFEVVDFFRDKAKDALGDIMVYLSHWCYMKNCYYSVKENSYNPNMEYRARLGQLTIYISQMLTVRSDDPAVYTTIATGIATVCSHIARDFGWDLVQDCLGPVWWKVQKRDWNKDSQNGGEEKEATQAALRGDHPEREAPKPVVEGATGEFN